MTVLLNPLYIRRMTPRASEYLSGTKPPVRIAVDMDEVIADYFGEQVARYDVERRSCGYLGDRRKEVAGVRAA
jgi:hypothetical protein